MVVLGGAAAGSSPRHHSSLILIFQPDPGGAAQEAVIGSEGHLSSSQHWRHSIPSFFNNNHLTLILDYPASPNTHPRYMSDSQLLYSLG